MGRSVSYPCDAIAVAYRDLDEIDYEDFDIVIDYVRSQCREFWPSFQDCDDWLDREDHALLENSFAYVGVSTYGGLCAVWLLPKEPGRYYSPENFERLANAWCEQIKPKFLATFGTLRRLATFSNGESVYERV